MRTDMRENVAKMLDKLTLREAQVLRLRFGIGMEGGHTHEEIGRQLDLTRDRIRAIEASAMRKLRESDRSGALRGYVTST